MQKKQVAVFDIGSSKITAVIGQRGVNQTFIIKGRYFYDYDGFADGAFFGVERLQRILRSLADVVRKNKIDTIYVGVPGEFTHITYVFEIDRTVNYSDGTNGAYDANRFSEITSLNINRSKLHIYANGEHILSTSAICEVSAI